MSTLVSLVWGVYHWGLIVGMTSAYLDMPSLLLLNQYVFVLAYMYWPILDHMPSLVPRSWWRSRRRQPPRAARDRRVTRPSTPRAPRYWPSVDVQKSANGDMPSATVGLLKEAAP